ncbi:MAG: MFS transporter [Paracoccaceae bacterium]
MNYLQFIRLNARWLAAALLLTFSSSYGQTYFISIFAGQIREEFGLSPGAWGGIYTIGTTASAILMIWAGVLTDRFRVRTIGPIVLALLALSCLAMAMVNSVAMLVVVIFALRFTGQGMTGHTAMVAMARWFVATRGRAMTVASMGFMIGQSVLPLIFVALLPFFHWRSLWVLAAVLALLMIPIQLMLLKDERTPQSVSKETQSVGMGGKQWTRSEVLHHWLFWLMVPSLLGPSAWGTALFFQQVHLSEVKGWSHVEFVALFPLFTVASILTNLVTGWAIDRFGTNRLMPFFMLPYVAAFLVLGAADSLQFAAVGMILVGMAFGAGSSMVGAFWAEHFGTLNLGAIKSMSTAVMVFGSAIGPGITGWLIDLGVDFPDQMFGIAIYFVIASAIAAIGVIRARPFLPTSPKVDIIRA